MAAEDRTRWNKHYQAKTHVARAPSWVLNEWGGQLPATGSALDVAGGTGHNALWLARRGLQTTLVDISDQALTFAQARADMLGLELATACLDLEQDSLPNSPIDDGTWDVIVCFNYLYRPLYRDFINRLAPGGWLLICQPTVTNLESHAKPSRRYLLERGELRELCQGLDPVRYEEGWTAQGRHLARILACKPGRARAR